MSSPLKSVVPARKRRLARLEREVRALRAVLELREPRLLLFLAALTRVLDVVLAARLDAIATRVLLLLHLEERALVERARRRRRW